MRHLALAIVVFCCTACTLPVSQSSLDLVDHDLTFAALRQDPELYLGRHILLGGAIVAVRNYNSGSELEVVQFATDRSGRITSTSNSEGRFIIQIDAFSEPAIYLGRRVTLVGKVVGKKSARIGELDYLYPVLVAQEVRFWSPGERDASRVRFGIGFGVGTVIH